MKTIKEIITTEKMEDEIQLCERSLEIDTQYQATELREIVKALKDTMRAKGLKSLSAPAIGYKRRIFCIDYTDLEIKTYVNPLITKARGLELTAETCTSIPGKKFMRPRNNDIDIAYQTPTGKMEQRNLVGLAAKVFQHEMDHLDGILLSDIGVEIPDEYETWNDEEKQQFAEDYLDSLDLLTKQLQEEVENDPELKQIQDAAEFMEKVYKGEVQIEKVENETKET